MPRDRGGDVHLERVGVAIEARKAGAQDPAAPGVEGGRNRFAVQLTDEQDGVAGRRQGLVEVFDVFPRQRLVVLERGRLGNEIREEGDVRLAAGADGDAARGPAA